jgi:hypothetical protein
MQGRRRGHAHFPWRKLTAIFQARTKLSEAEAKSIEEDSRRVGGRPVGNWVEIPSANGTQSGTCHADPRE